MYSYGVPNGPVIKHTLRCFWQALGENGELPFPVAFTGAQIDTCAWTQTKLSLQCLSVLHQLSSLDVLAVLMFCSVKSSKYFIVSNRYYFTQNVFLFLKM